MAYNNMDDLDPSNGSFDLEKMVQDADRRTPMFGSADTDDDSDD